MVSRRVYCSYLVRQWLVRLLGRANAAVYLENLLFLGRIVREPLDVVVLKFGPTLRTPEILPALSVKVCLDCSGHAFQTDPRRVIACACHRTLWKLRYVFCFHAGDALQVSAQDFQWHPLVRDYYRAALAGHPVPLPEARTC
jgi:hypothetical protein